jgi:putative ABC transport system permease protein
VIANPINALTIKKLLKSIKMLRNYLTIFGRILMRQKGYSFINIFGLAIGFAASLLIVLYIDDELSYDKFHKEADRIYRVGIGVVLKGQQSDYAITGAPVAETLYNEFSGIESHCRFWHQTATPIEYEYRSISDQKLIMADSNFFSFFSFKMLEGDIQTALIGPNKVVLSEDMARAIFGVEKKDFKTLIGKQILMGISKTTTEITAICANPPANSHFHFDAVLSSDSNLPKKNNYEFDELDCYSFIKLKPDTDVEIIRGQLRAFLLKYLVPQFVVEVINMAFEDWEKQGERVYYFLTPITGIHLDSHVISEFEQNGDRSYLYMLFCIACFILLLACLNFINLTTARASNRAKEVGIRKTIGAVRKKLITQFMGESFIYTCLALLAGLVLMAFFIPSFNELTGKNFHIQQLLSPAFILSISLMVVMITVISGSYPAFILASFAPVHMLKAKNNQGGRNSTARSFMVVFQFTVSVCFIIASIMVFKQIEFLQTQNPGFNKENVVCITNAVDLDKNLIPFKNEVRSNESFIDAAYCSQVPSEIITASGYRKKGVQQWNTAHEYFADEDYFKTLNLQFADGRFFSRDFPSDSSAVILNESAARLLGISNLGQKEYVEEAGEPNAFEVIGIVKDFNFESLKSEIKPLVICYGGKSRMLIRVTAGNFRDKIVRLEKIWKKHTSAPFEYSFLDERLDAQYQSEEKLSRIALVFTILSVFIACLGLLGLVTYVASQRTKEIGIRKVMGASVNQIVTLLSKDFLQLVVIAIVIALPVSWYGISQWLQTFAYRIDFSFGVAAFAGCVVVLIALLTLSYQSIKAAMENPVKSLRGE